MRGSKWSVESATRFLARMGINVSGKNISGTKKACCGLGVWSAIDYLVNYKDCEVVS